MSMLKVSALSVHLLMAQVLSISEYAPKNLNRMSGNSTMFHVVLQSGGNAQ